MLDKELTRALSDQMVYEIYSSYIYLAMAAKLERMKLPGAAHWMRTQTDEELIHANIFYVYLNDQDCEIEFGPVAKPELKGATPIDIFGEALHHEQLVTARINKLMELAMKSGQYSTMTFLHFFINEQVQEEKSVQQIIDRLSLAGDSREALLFIDAELAARPAATPPASTTATV